jgi:hypothetical protein
MGPSKRFPNFFSLFLIILLATNYFVPCADLDFTWQIRTGEQIVRTGRLRPVDAFTYTIAGHKVPEFEWLYEVLLWGVWNVWGYGGLKLVRTILVATPLLLLGLRLRKEAVPWPGLALVIILAVFVLSPAWNLRPLCCTTIGLLLVWGWLHDHCNGRKPLSLWLPLVMLLWGNLHPGVITGQGLLAGAIAWEWLNRRLKIQPALTPTACWRLTWLGGLGLAATFVSPDPWERLLYPFRPEVGDAVQRIFIEMQPLYIFLARPPYVAGIVYLVAALVSATVFLRFRHYRLWEVALLAGLAGLANLAVRSLQDWFLLMLAIGVPHVTVLLKELVGWAKSSRPTMPSGGPRRLGPPYRLALSLSHFLARTLNSPAFRFQWLWPVAFLGLLTLVSLFPPLSRRMPIQESKEWPVAALDWAEAQGLRGRFFSPPDYGSYIGWRLGDRARTYVDTRGFFFPPAVIEDSHYVPQLGPEWQFRMERILARQTDYFLLETTGARGQLWQWLRPRIDQPLYRDDQAVLLSAIQVRQALAAPKMVVKARRDLVPADAPQASLISPARAARRP